MPDRLTILQGDCRETLKTLLDESVQCCVTSPPYYGLRDYGHSGQMGLESTPDDYVQSMVDVFREVRRVLASDGTCWLNLGDSYAGSWGAQSRGGPPSESSTLKGNGHVGGGPKAKNISAVQIAAHPKRTHTGSIPAGSVLKPKDLIGIPWRVAFALQADGWYLRQDIIWAKPNPMPESVTDRCTKAHEYIFLLSKSERYHFDNRAISEPLAMSSIARLNQNVAEQIGSPRVPGKTNGNMKAVGPRFGGSKYGDDESEYNRTKSGNVWTVWTVTTKPYKGAHFATFPPDLIEPCILAGCPANGTVLDPFGGSGTTAQVALTHGRNAILCELNPEYVSLIHQRCDPLLAPKPEPIPDLFQLRS